MLKMCIFAKDGDDSDSNFVKAVPKGLQKRWFKSYPIKSVYEVKNNFCLFERPFKIQKKGVFLFFEISSFVSEILTFFYYAN